MHRFRKKSETRRSGQVPSSDSEETSPQIPLPNDFRTSLILPDLSRRFSLLRSSTGEPVGLDVLRSRLADQRARGTANHISEEEEEMLFDTLRSLRARTNGSAQQSADSLSASGTEDARQSTISSVQSTHSLAPSSASITSSPSGRSTKRYSNNLFGSGRFNDYNYLRTVAKERSRTQSLTPTESSNRGNTSDSFRSTTPDSSGVSSSAQSSLKVSENTPSVRSAPLAAPAPFGDQVVSAAEYRLSKTLGPSALKRASMAIEEVIREFEEEEEADDEIVMPRSTPIPRGNAGHPPSDPARNSALSQSSIFEAVMAISSDKQVQSDPDVIDRRASPVPSRIVPGYVPGMPRPMTPREFDVEERSHSTTPRATSPMAASFTDTSIPNISSTGRLRSNSTASQSGVRPPTSPLFLQRSPNSGRFTPEDRSNSIEFENPLNSSLLAARRRPASPLASPPFQPMAVSSRPSTPSNIVWNVSQSSSGHSRDESWASDGAISSSDVHGAHDRYTSGPRPLHSPPLPDSPTEGSSFNLNALGSVSYHSSNPSSELGPRSTMTLAELGSPNRAARSVTPTQGAARSPTMSTFPDLRSSVDSKRSSKQNPPSNSIPPLVFSPLINSSRSSLESTGSSYHTWDAEEKDRSAVLFSDPDIVQPVWHELSSSSSATPGDSPDDDWNPEEVVARITGLRKSDFVAIQEKLLSARDAKEREYKQEPQERAASALRKRRPSTSQSNYSTAGREPRVASPPPQIQTSPSKVTTVSPLKMDRSPSALDTSVPSPISPQDKELSPTTRRNRDLAQALFGMEEVASGQISIPESAGQAISPDQSLKSPPTNLDAHSSSSTLSPSFASPYSAARNPSVPRIPQTPQEEAQLAREVQEKIQAATEFLKPSNGSHSPDPNATISRKRISPSQISTPRLVVASTSVVDTVPIVKAPSISSTNASGPSKIGSRFKKLRGTLRAKNALPNGDEITPYSLDPHSPSPSQTANYDPGKLKVPGAPASAVDSRFKVPVPSPPASAGPSLKGFMARFRGKQRPAADLSAEPEHRLSPQPSPQLLSQQASSLPATSGNEKSFSQPLSSPLGRKPVPVSRPQTPQAQSAPPTQEVYEDSAPVEPTESSDMTALRQLFEAANRIGIDQGELNALLARSGSTSSKADWKALTRSNSAVRPGAATPADSSRMTPSIGRPSIDDQSMRALTPDPKAPDRGSGRPSMESQAPRDKSVSRQVSRKQADHARRAREGKGGDNNVVVRKTIIFPDQNMTTDELKRFMEKSMPGRRASVTSVSSRSIHDRAPTPPPPRSPTYKRFSNGPSPPVPSLPTALGNLNVPVASAGGPIEKSNSTYDSLYDMYAGESRSPSAVPNESGPSRPQDDSSAAPEPQAAVELIHLANGETIWNIVNGLREDDDEQSVYTRRTSFASEYYPREAPLGGGGIQIFVKEHERSGSAGSASSMFKRGQGKPRPETKVYHSPAGDIGRLIQDLSRNMEAGSFNFAARPGHSASSSLSTNDMTWTLEERLDEMIDTVRAK
ncbi:hypothetical protein LshimejAT787_0209610 [Lyophyllum shimeji]|uniref:Uncharacterized protein n=1 Tax=Lyophyllum shimeji TaxID=47721 RepID=A0A9P3ULH7_LYOSH|nr:hypothetical protein LshimejAT787_0209610 [Lyophyllum shimeji]